MKIAVMQPYFLPYVGYFQLISSVERFLIYDDVSYIKGGWINRNQLLLNGNPQLFTIPLANGRSGTPIKDVKIALNFNAWRAKFLRTLTHAYKKSQNFEEIFEMLKQWLDPTSEKIVEINKKSLIQISQWLGIETQFIQTSSGYRNAKMGRRERLVDICRSEGADVFVNPSGGQKLYDKKWFSENGIELRFHDSHLEKYHQMSDTFVPNLSILDLLMNVSAEDARQIVQKGSFS